MTSPYTKRSYFLRIAAISSSTFSIQRQFWKEMIFLWFFGVLVSAAFSSVLYFHKFLNTSHNISFSIPPAYGNAIVDNFDEKRAEESFPDRVKTDMLLSTNTEIGAIITTAGASSCPQYTCPGTAGCTYLISGVDASNYNVYSGEKICIESGASFTGQVGLYGGEIQNCATNPQSFTYFIDGSSPLSTFNNYGNFEITNSPSVQDSLVINNYGVFSVYNLTVRLDAIFNNYCTTNVGNNLYIAATGALNNYGCLDAVLNFTTENNASIILSGGCITANQMFNEGTIQGNSCGNITINTNTNNTATGSLLGDIGFIDLTPPGSPPYIDTNNGTVGASVVWTSCTSCTPVVEEICNNGIDDDGDGDIDGADSDCCGAQAPVLSKN